MSAVEVFQFPATGASVRTVVRDGEPWFVAGDVCRVLGVANVPDAVASLDDDEKGVVTTDTPGGQQRVRVVNEPGLYSLILRSRKPEAKAFKRWVTHEVLPTIRRTGRFESAPALPQTYAQALRELAASVERTEQIERELEAAAPKVEAWDVLASAHGDYSVREAAFILNRDPAIDTGQKRLFQLLRDWKLVDRRDIPYADHARHIRLRARSYQSPRTGEDRATEQVRITAEGLKYLHRRMGGTQPLGIEAAA
jgi:anti-repressor protein